MTTNKAGPVLNIILHNKIVHDRYIASMFKNFNQITKKGRVQHEETKYTIADYSSFLKLPSGSDRPAGAAKTPSQVGRGHPPGGACQGDQGNTQPRHDLSHSHTSTSCAPIVLTDFPRASPAGG